MAGIPRKIREAIAWIAAIGHVLGWLGWLSIVTGFAVSVGGAVWAMITGVPIPIAVMAGFCTLVGAVYLMMAPAIFQSLVRPLKEQTNTHKPEKISPDYKAWGHIQRLTIFQAAHLWCDRDPNIESGEVVPVV